MAKISVNEEYVIKGKITIRRYINENNELIILGTFATHYYFEEIKSLETYRYLVEKIDVYEELFGSDDFDIIYNFKAKKLTVKNGFSNLTDEEIAVLEADLYETNGYTKDSNIKILT